MLFRSAGTAGVVTPSASPALTGVDAVGAVGSVTFQWVAGGNQANGAVGTVTVAERTIALTGVAAQGLLGTDVPVVLESVSGVSATGAVGSVGHSKTVALSGVSANGLVGSFGVLYWSLIDDNQTANWQNINTTQASDWVLVETE